MIKGCQTFKNYLSHFRLLLNVHLLNHHKDDDGDKNSYFILDDNFNKRKKQPHRGRGRGTSRERQVRSSNGRGKASGKHSRSINKNHVDKSSKMHKVPIIIISIINIKN